MLLSTCSGTYSSCTSEFETTKLTSIQGWRRTTRFCSNINKTQCHSQLYLGPLCSTWIGSTSHRGTWDNRIRKLRDKVKRFQIDESQLGVSGYIVYVGGLWYLSNTGRAAFPYFSSVCIGISAGLIFVTNGYIMLSYPEEKEKGLYVTTGFGLLAGGEIIGGIIPLLISRNNDSDGGVPNAVYIAFIVIMVLTAVAGLFILPPNKITRDDGSKISDIKYRGIWTELKSNLKDLCDVRLLIMIPCFLPAECYLVYLGSVNAFHNNLRTRCLCSFMSVVLQIPFSIVLVSNSKEPFPPNVTVLGVVSMSQKS